nr:PTS sugar transporter subunit IIC [Lactococcus fujiensis]
MHITLFQGILLALAAVIQGIDFWLEGLYIFRPIIVSTIAGLILGDLQTGLVVGGVTELAFAGLTPAGGTQPPNPILAGVMGVVLAHVTGAHATAAMALALPFSLLMQYVILFFYSSFSFFMHRIEKAARIGNTNSIARINFFNNGYCGSNIWNCCIFMWLLSANSNERFCCFPTGLAHSWV